ncbi:MAG: prolipoprotein diacylglyceryl transferase [Acidiferrobacterales bacterium]
MLKAPYIDPIAIKFGPVGIHWYGLMYVIGFIAGWWLGVYRASRPGSGWRKEEISDLLVYAALGAVLGGRLGYVIFYNPGHYLAHPLEVFQIWKGGMSFHGGLAGVILAMFLYAWKTQRSPIAVTDFIAPLVPIGLGAGRIGNFINHELWGRVTDLPWGMIFRGAGPEPRHPTQLYEFALEGVALFVILWLYSAKPRPVGAVSVMFLLCYAIFRIAVEFVREPDAHIGYLAFGWLTMGHALSLLMILVAAGVLVWMYRKGNV